MLNEENLHERLKLNMFKKVLYAQSVVILPFPDAAMPLKPVLLMLFLMAGCMPPIHADAKIAAAVPVSVKNVNNCYKLSRELYRSAQPDDDGFKALENRASNPC